MKIKAFEEDPKLEAIARAIYEHDPIKEQDPEAEEIVWTVDWEAVKDSYPATMEDVIERATIALADKTPPMALEKMTTLLSRGKLELKAIRDVPQFVGLYSADAPDAAVLVGELAEAEIVVDIWNMLVTQFDYLVELKTAVDDKWDTYIHEVNGVFHWSDEASQLSRPYTTREGALADLKAYAAQLERAEEPHQC